MEKITIKPTAVRGQGNVLEPKNISEYSELSCEVESIEDNRFKLNPIFFNLFLEDSSNLNKTEFYSKSLVYVDAWVRYSNSNVVTSDPRLGNQQLLKLYMDGELLASTYIDSKGFWTHNTTLDGFTVGVHEFQLKFKDIESQIFRINVLESIGSITLSTDKTEAYINENVTWTAKVKDENGNNLSGKTVKFYESPGGEVLATRETNANGEATFTSTRSDVNTYGYMGKSIYAICTDVRSSTKTVTFWNHNVQSMSCELDKTEICISESVSMEVEFKDHFGNNVYGGLVNVCIDGANSNEYSVELRNNKYYVTYTPSSSGTKSLKVYSCSNVYIFSNKTITVNKVDASLTANMVNDWVPLGSSCVLNNGVTYHGVAQNVNLKLYVDNTLITSNLSSNSRYTMSSLTKGVHTIKVVLDDARYEYKEVTTTVAVGAVVKVYNLNEE